MLDKINNLKSKFKKKASSHKKISAQDRLFKSWHNILLAYVICNIVFIIISVAVSSGLTQRVVDGDVANDQVDARINSQFNERQLAEIIQLQRYKDLVNQGVIAIPQPPNF